MTRSVIITCDICESKILNSCNTFSFSLIHDHNGEFDSSEKVEGRLTDICLDCFLKIKHFLEEEIKS